MRVLVVEDDENVGGAVRRDHPRHSPARHERPRLPEAASPCEAGLPIVAVSGVATESQARECLRLGALDFVDKPVALDRLGEVLEYLEPHALSRRHAAGARAPARSARPRATVKVHFTPDGGEHLSDGDAQRLRDLVARTKA